MFGFGHFYELLIVLIIALVIFGPKRLPELGSSLGKGIKEFRKATNELQDSIKGDTSATLPPEPEHYTASATTHTTPVHTANAEYTAAPAASTTTTPATTTAPAHGDQERPRI